MDSELIAIDGAPVTNGQFGKGLLLGGALFMVLWGIAFGFSLGRPHVNNAWVDQAYEKKFERVDELGPRPKVIVVAGSAAMFGIDSRQLGLALDRPVVNLGVNAGIGPIHIIERVRSAINPGDTVLLPLEYPLYIFDWDINQVFLDYLLSYPQSIVSEPWHFWPRVLWLTSLERVYQAYHGIPDDFHVQGLYGPHNLDRNGDQINSALSDRVASIHAGALNSQVERYGRVFKREAHGWRLWLKFHRDIVGQGSCVLFVPPPMLDRAEYHDDPEEGRFYRHFADVVREAGLPYAGQPYDFMYPADWFFDTNYHLVAERKSSYTQAVAALTQSQSLPCLASGLLLDVGVD